MYNGRDTDCMCIINGQEISMCPIIVWTSNTLMRNIIYTHHYCVYYICPGPRLPIDINIIKFNNFVYMRASFF